MTRCESGLPDPTMQTAMVYVLIIAQDVLALGGCCTGHFELNQNKNINFLKPYI